MMHRLSLTQSGEGGVEEKKEDDVAVLSPTASAPQPLSPTPDDVAAADEKVNSFDEMDDGFLQNFAKYVLGSCGNALSFLGWPGNDPPQAAGAPPRAPLSITDELRRLAAKEGRVFGGGMRRADIPRFLGEEGVYSFEDDNVSAISQNTIEEMAKHGMKYPIRRKTSSESSQE